MTADGLLPEQRIDHRNYKLSVEKIASYPSNFYILFWREAEHGTNEYRIVGARTGNDYGRVHWHPINEPSLALIKRSLHAIFPDGTGFTDMIARGKVTLVLF